jgi:hypothetical protein
MAIKRDELTDEQYAKLKKLYRNYHLSLALSTLLYIAFLFFANFAVLMIDYRFVHRSEFRFVMCLANTVITIGGIRGTMEEKRAVFVQKVKELVGHL